MAIIWLRRLGLRDTDRIMNFCHGWKICYGLIPASDELAGVFYISNPSCVGCGAGGAMNISGWRVASSTRRQAMSKCLIFIRFSDTLLLWKKYVKNAEYPSSAIDAEAIAPVPANRPRPRRAPLISAKDAANRLRHLHITLKREDSATWPATTRRGGAVLSLPVILATIVETPLTHLTAKIVVFAVMTAIPHLGPGLRAAQKVRSGKAERPSTTVGALIGLCHPKLRGNATA